MYSFCPIDNVRHIISNVDEFLLSMLMKILLCHKICLYVGSAQADTDTDEVVVWCVKIREVKSTTDPFNHRSTKQQRGERILVVH